MKYNCPILLIDGNDNIITATNAPSTKQLLLERWILLLNIFCLDPDKKIVLSDCTDEIQESSPTELNLVSDHGSDDLSIFAYANAYAAAVGMVDTACACVATLCLALTFASHSASTCLRVSDIVAHLVHKNKSCVRVSHTPLSNIVV